MSINAAYGLSPTGILLPIQLDASSNLKIVGILQAIAGTNLLADQANTELRISLYGTQITAGDTAIGVTSTGLIKAQANLQVGNTNVGNNNPIPITDVFGIQVTNSATGAAAATVTATLPSVAAKTTALTGFIISCAPVAAVVSGVVTITGLIGGAASFVFVETVATGGLLGFTFPNPLVASAVNTAIAVVVPAIAGGSAVSVFAAGYQN
jgi:hypothetical protein